MKQRTARSSPPSAQADTEQRKRFIDMAREIGADEDAKTFADKLRRIAKAPPAEKAKKKSV